MASTFDVAAGGQFSLYLGDTRLHELQILPAPRAVAWGLRPVIRTFAAAGAGSVRVRAAGAKTGYPGNSLVGWFTSAGWEAWLPSLLADSLELGRRDGDALKVLLVIHPEVDLRKFRGNHEVVKVFLMPADLGFLHARVFDRQLAR